MPTSKELKTKLQQLETRLSELQPEVTKANAELATKRSEMIAGVGSLDDLAHIQAKITSIGDVIAELKNQISNTRAALDQTLADESWAELEGKISVHREAKEAAKREFETKCLRFSELIATSLRGIIESRFAYESAVADAQKTIQNHYQMISDQEKAFQAFKGICEYNLGYVPTCEFTGIITRLIEEGLPLARHNQKYLTAEANLAATGSRFVGAQKIS